MKRPVLVWFVKRIFVPVTWYAPAVFVGGAVAPGRLVEFLGGAVILIAWAVLADWPFGREPDD